VVVVAGDIAAGGIFDLAGGVGEAIPNGLAFAVGVPGAFNLIAVAAPQRKSDGNL
jgi:hypothetical protein